MLQKKKLTCLIALLFLVFGFTANARTYYVSNSGDDSNSGTDASSPWQTLNKVNSFKGFVAGDNILFRRGDTFYGGITASNAGRSGNPITYGAYGSGAKPLITGFTSVTSWTNKGGNIWESSNEVSSLPTLKMVVVNGVNTPMGRYPNASTSYPFLPNFFHFQSHTGTGNGNSSITSNSLSGGSNWTGAEVVVRTNSWTYDKQTIRSQSGSTLNYVGESAGISDDWGFFIQNDLKTLDVQNEWYYNPSTKKISIYSAGMPTSVQVSSIETLFYLYSNTPSFNSTNVDNINFIGANTNALWISGNLTFSVTNCDVSHSGFEGMLLYGGGIQNGTINNNTFSNCGSSGIFAGGTVNSLTIKSNKIVGSGIISAYKPNDYTNGGITSTAPGSLIQYNTVDSSAYCGIEFKGENVQVRNNFVNHSNMVRDDGGGIYTGYKNEGGKIIDGNIILNAVGNTNGGPSDKQSAAYGIFIDDFGNNISITNNTIANCTMAGINLHGTKNVTVTNNTAYNNGVPGWGNGNLFVQADAGPFTSYVRDNSVTNNIFFAKSQNQSSIKYYADPNGDNNVTSFGTIDYNYYAKPINASTAVTSQQGIGKGDMSLSQWQSLSGKDANSKESPKAITDVNDLRFEYNATNQSKTIALDANYIDVKGNNYNGSITLAPYSSAVLIKNGESTNLLPAVNPSNTVNGIDYKYYEGGNYSVVPDFSTASPIKTGALNNFDLSIANRAEIFATNFTGYIDVPADGQYTFYTSSDDGSNLYIDDVQVVDNDGLHGDQEKSGTIGLKAGKHAISVGFFQQAGDKVLRVSYAGAGVSKQVIPSSALYRVSTGDGLLPAVNPSNTTNGIDYKYYEASNYSVVPDFAGVSPVKTGALNNFDLSIANKSEIFATNFAGYIDVPADGQYTFYTSSDDGSNLYIDGVQVVDNDGLHSDQEKSGTIGLKAGKHAISVGFFQQSGDKVLRVSYAGPGLTKQAIPSSALYRVSTDDGLLPAVNPSNTTNGLNYRYFEGSDYPVVPDFAKVSPVKIGTVNNFDLSIAERTEVFAVNFTGYVDVPADGEYTFYTSSDDGSNLYIDGIKVVNNDGLHSEREISGTVGLKAGKHAISVDFFQQSVDKVLQVSYAGPGVSKQVIPSSALYRVSTGFSSDDVLLPAVNPSNTTNGLNYRYYESSSNYSVVPDFSRSSPVKTGTVNDFDLSIAKRTWMFAANFAGYINVPEDGQYTFYTSSDDGSLLYIDGIKVVDNDGLHSTREKSGNIGLKAGKHAISVDFFQQLGEQILRVNYEGPGISKQAVPSSALYRVSSQNRMANTGATSDTNNTAISANDHAEAVTNGLDITQLKVGITAYPNPFTNSIVVSITGEAGAYHLLLVDALGRTIWTRGGTKSTGSYQQSINTSSMQRGIYFLKVIQNNKTAVIKLQK